MKSETPIFLMREPGRYLLPGELRSAMRGHWVSAAVGVLLLLAVSCVCGWCLHRLKHVEQQQRSTSNVQRVTFKGSSPMPMAQMPVGNTLVLVGLLAAACGLVGLAALRGRGESGEEERGQEQGEEDRGEKIEDLSLCPYCQSKLLFSEERGPNCDGCDEFNEDADAQMRSLKSLSLRGSQSDMVEDSAAAVRMLPEGLERVDVALMLAAYAHELRDIQGVVEAARRNQGVEDYGAAMEDVENRLRLLHVAMCELGARFADVSRAYFGQDRSASNAEREMLKGERGGSAV